jgi:hypothetical protein
MAAANSVVDVAMNAQGVELERRYGRPILSSMHAGHSAGLFAGGLAGTAAAAAAVTPLAHFAATAVLGVIAGLTATRCDAARRARGRTSSPRSRSGRRRARVHAGGSCGSGCGRPVDRG